MRERLVLSFLKFFRRCPPTTPHHPPNDSFRKLSKYKEKKGQLGDQIMYMMFLFLMVVIAAGIVGGVLLFFGGEYDFREAEAAALLHKVEQCIFRENIVHNAEVQWNDFYNACGIEKNVGEQYLLLEVRKNGEEVFSVNKGKAEGCKFVGARSNEAYPRCIIRDFVYNGERYEIIAGSEQHIRRVSA